MMKHRAGLLEAQRWREGRGKEGKDGGREGERRAKMEEEKGKEGQRWMGIVVHLVNQNSLLLLAEGERCIGMDVCMHVGTAVL